MEKKYAILIDGDNIAPSYLDSIISEVSKEGEVLIKRLYGDWTTPNMNGWKPWLEKVPIRPVQQFRNGPNATDNTIIMDAIELANTNQGINAVCIVSTDSDYYSLALKLREYGLYVLGVGRSNAKPLWVNACNEFKYLENFDETEEYEEDSKSGKKFKSLEDLICHAYRNSRMTEEGWVSLSDLGNSIRNFMPEFDPRSYSHNTLREIIDALSDDFELSSDDRIPPNYWIKAISRKNETPKVKGKIKRLMNRYGIIENENGDFFFSFTNIDKKCRDKLIKEGTPVKFRVFKMPNPKGGDSADRNGKAAEIEIIG
ncbi:NYN domain-containing protein [Treponema sp. OMZ 788]|uniref:NYN domain-containing protein n=1 Tax=unclassified Treponema TaxID=2638727 RepID=UPI0020A51647|nr:MULTISPECIES: NYN domain-containing protein [unclassified Treponema]UTC63090.1 NYN domain-containing protein [Treponema sp. OMZ 787]UTC64078.1 NYN domain-containing protein [Treponema sp. OMZ 788]